MKDVHIPSSLENIRSTACNILSTTWSAGFIGSFTFPENIPVLTNIDVHPALFAPAISNNY